MIDDEKLMAYADGELDAEARAEVEAAMAADPAVRERVEAHRQLRTLVSGAYAGATDEPMPERLSAMLKPRAEVIDLGEARARKAEAARPTARPAWRNWSAIAATFVVGILAGRMIDLAPAPTIATRGGALVAEGALAERLDTQLAASGSGIGLSFRNRDGEYCRTFRAARLAGLACRDARGWDVRMAVAAAAASGNYRMAASEMPPAVLEAVEAAIAGEPLDAREEAAARAKGWRD